MLIKDFRKPDDYFGNIEPGTVFAVEDSIYMAIEPIEEKELGVQLNAVNLDTDFIQVVEAELCVR